MSFVNKVLSDILNSKNNFQVDVISNLSFNISDLLKCFLDVRVRIFTWI